LTVDQRRLDTSVSPQQNLTLNCIEGPMDRQDRKVERRLAAILAADVVGASGLMEADESGTLSAIRTILSEIIEPAASRHRGRIVKTMGQRITKLKPVGGFAAETAGSITLFMATHFGIPVSTTHTITGAIIGVGTTRGTAGVRWAVAGNIVIAWILTIPASAAIAALAWWIGGVLL
jgi:class 3 adenylate cyclase